MNPHSTKSLVLRLILVLCALFISCEALLAQGGSGKVTGVAMDESGLVIPEVQVEVTHQGTGEMRRVNTNESGVYVLSQLPVGNYRLKAQKEGFRVISHQGIQIDVNSAITLNLRFVVGEVTETVSVEAQVATIETEVAAIGNSRYEAQLKNLPIIVREVQALVGQTAGVPYGTTDTVGGSFNQGGRSAMQVLSDGVQLNPLQTTAWPAIDGIGRRADLTVPGIDSIAEVKWTSNGASAEYSQPTQVIVASKAGTNDIHGSLFEFYRSGGMGARRWEAPARDSFVRHQYGASIGGPIRRNKMFYHAAFENFRHTSSLNLNARYPTAAERRGDLSSLLQRTDAAGNPAPVSIFDPLTQQPFPNNVIPGDRISPVANELLKLIPEAPAPGGRITDFNAIYFKPQYDNSEKYDARFDYNLNERNRLFVRTTIAHLDQASRYSGDVPGTHGASTKDQWTHAVSANWTRTINPTTLAVFQFTFRNMPFNNIPSNGDETFPIKINDLDPKPPFAGPPAIAIQANGLGIGTLFDRLLFNYSADYSYSLEPTLTKTIGNHTLKGGLTFLKGYKTTELASPPYGRFTTASDFNNPRSTTSATGDAFADFLLGYPSTTDVTIGQVGGSQKKTNFSFFLQNDWKVSPKLTLNLGVRYDNFGFFEEWDQRASVGHFPTGKVLIPDDSKDLIHPAFQQFSDRYITASEVGLPDTFVRPNNWDFAPRLGFAYRVQPDFVVRGGFGIYYVDVTINEFRSAVNVAPFTRRAQLSRSLLLSQGIDVNSIYTFQNPTANSSAAGADTQLTTLDGFNEEYPTQRAYTWNVTLEKDLGRQMGLRASYVGNVGRHLSRVVRVNACVPGPTECLSRAAGDPTGRRWRQFNTSIGQRWGDGESNFNSAEIELQKRFSAGLLFDVNYAFSRSFRFQPEASNPVADPQSHYDYGPVSNAVTSATDATFTGQPAHIFHWNYVYELPVGKGRRLAANMNRVAEAILGGWMLSGLGTWQSGSTLNVVTSNGQSPTGATTNRADRIGNGKRDHSGLSRGEKALQWFDTAAFQQPAFIDASAPRPTRHFGTAASGVVTGPSFFTYDMTVHKTFTVKEAYQLQFRLEVFNPFNIPMLGNPITNVADANFGRIRTSNTNYTPRNIQLGLRLDF